MERNMGRPSANKSVKRCSRDIVSQCTRRINRHISWKFLIYEAHGTPSAASFLRRYFADCRRQTDVDSLRNVSQIATRRRAKIIVTRFRSSIVTRLDQLGDSRVRASVDSQSRREETLSYRRCLFFSFATTTRRLGGIN